MYDSEKFNSISHLIGAIFSLMGLGALLTVSFYEQNLLLFIGYLTFGLTLVMLYIFSTLYHSLSAPYAKRVFQKLDHVAIYLLIAGTYTPFTLVTLIDSSGLNMLIAVWSLAFIGISLDLFVKNRIELIQIAIYLIMGWLVVVDFSELKEALPFAGIFWLTAGGLAYTIGITFYVLDHKKLLRHAHGIWHLFVLAGSISHFIAIIGYVR